jgi:hypothetical protein
LSKGSSDGNENSSQLGARDLMIVGEFREATIGINRDGLFTRHGFDSPPIYWVFNRKIWRDSSIAYSGQLHKQWHS